MDYIELLFQAIKENKHHRDYDRTVQVANDCRKIMAGDGQKEWILSYKDRETARQKEQRLHITISRTEAEANRYITLTDKISRVDNVIDNIYYENESADRTRIDKCIAEFWQGESLGKYLHDFNQYTSFYDPNAWLFINFEKVNGLNVPYPVEFSSKEVYQYSESINTLNWFIARQDIGRGLSRFVFIAPDISIVAEQLDIDSRLKDDWNIYSIEDTKYQYKVSLTESQQTAVFKAGYIKDNETQRRTFVSFLHPALNVFKRLINDGSEFDLSMALHGFLQKWQYANVCEYEEETPDETLRCHNGFLGYGKEKRKCDNCKGIGLVLHVTSQDVILVKHPDGKDEHIPLSEMAHYLNIPFEVIEQQQKNIDRDIEDIQIALLNTQLVDNTEIQRNVTATEKTIDLDNINNVLYKHGCNFSRLYKQVVKQAAIYMGVDKGLIVNHEYPKDFLLESLQQLFALRKQAIDSYAPYATIESIDTKI